MAPVNPKCLKLREELMIKKIILTVTLCVGVNAFSLETDNFLAETANFYSGTEKVNTFINDKIKSYLELNKESLKRRSCNTVRDKALRSFRGIIIHDIEEFIDTKLDVPFIYPDKNLSKSDYYEKSIYNDSLIDVLRMVRLSRSIMIGDIVIGSDKFSPFISTGVRYFNTYQKYLRKGYSKADSTRQAIDYGVFTEKYFLGRLGSKVLSFADLEANYQGLIFNIKFCEGDNSYLYKSEKGWELRREVDVEDYVNPYWSEVFNPSYFFMGRFKSVKRNIENNYCNGIDDQQLRDRIEYYSSFASESFSVKYLEHLVGLNSLPDRKDQIYGLDCIYKK